SEVPGGVFTIAYKFARSAAIPDYDRELLSKCLRWFNDHLDAPDIGRPGRSCARVIFWFKHSAKEHIDIMRDLVSILDRNDIPTRVVTARRAGYVIYEDKYQLAAEPFHETRSILRAA
ncbi:MAG: hypothetical protein ACREDR_45690, partial [Blastocatellia bacterium]